MRKKPIPEVLVELSERRSSTRQPIPEVSVELRRNIDSDTPDWVSSAVNISLRGMLLQLPLETSPGALLYVGFTLGGSHVFSRLVAVVLRRELGELGVLGFRDWPLDKQYELSLWLQKQAAEEEPHP